MCHKVWNPNPRTTAESLAMLEERATTPLDRAALDTLTRAAAADVASDLRAPRRRAVETTWQQPGIFDAAADGMLPGLDANIAADGTMF